MNELRVGFAMCGSFCTFSQVIPQIERLKAEGYDIFPIMSEMAYSTDTRFGNAKEINEKIEQITGNKIIHTIKDAEPIGPKALLDVLIIEPCTGNTLAKLANGITDSSVTMAAKAHLRNNRPVLVAISTNDGLSASAPNLGALLCRKNYYFVPFGQDDPIKKPTSLVAHLPLTQRTLEAALEGSQFQPLLLQK